jgi:predicted nucleic acid-binding protein
VIVYLDTSALVKPYVEEAESTAVVTCVERATSVTTARVSYAEARAAFARSRREGGLTLAGLRAVVRNLDVEWGAYDVVEIHEPLVRRAAQLAERHALRGSDAIHLAAALEVRSASADVEFASFDSRLNHAAARERLRLSPV